MRKRTDKISFDEARRWFGYEPNEPFTVNDLDARFTQWKEENADNSGPDHAKMAAAFMLLYRDMVPDFDDIPPCPTPYSKEEKNDMLLMEYDDEFFLAAGEYHHNFPKYDPGQDLATVMNALKVRNIYRVLEARRAELAVLQKEAPDFPLDPLPLSADEQNDWWIADDYKRFFRLKQSYEEEPEKRETRFGQILMLLQTLTERREALRQYLIEHPEEKVVMTEINSVIKEEQTAPVEAITKPVIAEVTQEEIVEAPALSEEPSSLEMSVDEALSVFVFDAEEDLNLIELTRQFKKLAIRDGLSPEMLEEIDVAYKVLKAHLETPKEMTENEAREIFSYGLDEVVIGLELTRRYRNLIRENYSDEVQDKIDAAYLVLFKIAA